MTLVSTLIAVLLVAGTGDTQKKNVASGGTVPLQTDAKGSSSGVVSFNGGPAPHASLTGSGSIRSEPSPRSSFWAAPVTPANVLPNRDPVPWAGTTVGAILMLLALAVVANDQRHGWYRYQRRKRSVMAAFWLIVVAATGLKIYLGSYASGWRGWRQSMAWLGEDIILGVTLSVILWLVLAYLTGVSPLRETTDKPVPSRPRPIKSR